MYTVAASRYIGDATEVIQLTEREISVYIGDATEVIQLTER